MAVDTSRFEAQRRSILDNYASQSTANTFARQQNRVQADRGQQDFTRGFKRSFPAFNASFGARGLAGPSVQSGVQRQALSNMAGDYTRDLGRMRQDAFSSDQQFGIGQGRLDAMRNQALADLEAEKARQIAMTASNINALRPSLG